ncbi:hypothetical protein ABK040_016540 [Willaertia magna]
MSKREDKNESSPNFLSNKNINSDNDANKMEEREESNNNDERIIYCNPTNLGFSQSEILQNHAKLNINPKNIASSTNNNPIFMFLSIFCDNTIRNTKYQWHNFLWKSLREQFRLRMNQYFLVLACLQMWKAASPTNPISTWIPLLLVMIVGITKEGIDDYLRYKKDLQINLERVTVFRNGKFLSIPSYQAHVGDLMIVKENEQIKADLIVIKSSNNSSGNSSIAKGNLNDSEVIASEENGNCWIETSALDGEFNYKKRKAIAMTQNNWLSTSSFNLNNNDAIKGMMNDSNNYYSNNKENIQKKEIKEEEEITIEEEDQQINNIDEEELIEMDEILESNEKDLLLLKNEENENYSITIMNHLSSSDIQLVNEFSGIIQCCKPNSDLDQFNGYLLIPNNINNNTVDINNENNSDINNKMDKYNITTNNLLLQGTFLKTTNYIIGLVIYTGNETKIGMNKKEIEMKWTKMDIFLNQIIIFIFILQFLIGLLFGITGYYKNYSSIPGSSGFINLIAIILRFMMLCSLMIPQSVKITSDIAKYFISIFMIEKDPKYPNQTVIAANTSIAEELGQINYIFTDKTGTLTENVMNIKKMILNGESKDLSSFDNELVNTDTNLEMLLKNLAICHTVYCENEKLLDDLLQKRNDILFNLNNSYKHHYISTSPEEETFVNFCLKRNITLQYRDDKRIILSIFNKEENNIYYEEYKILKVLHFSFERKRMSIIVKKDKIYKQNEILNCDNEYYIFCKGADDVLSERMIQNDLLNQTLKNVSLLASEEGLRVMMMSGKKLSEKEVFHFLQKLNEIATNSFTTIENNHSPNILQNKSSLQNAIPNVIQNEEDLYDLVEYKLNVYGAIGMEDKLQDGVPECIDSLQHAGIKIFMLTGDKMETSVSIGITCKLITKDQNLFYLKGDNEDLIYQQLQNCLNTSNNEKLFSLIFEGKILKYILDKEENVNLFLQLIKQCQSCICCRMTPKWKGKIVNLMKGNDKLTNDNATICLAIGDGSNDINMILEADVGVGITTTPSILKQHKNLQNLTNDEKIDLIHNLEHLQAFRQADYGIPTFSYLKKLLLYHGRNSYKKLSLLTQYTMYKSIILSGCQLTFNYLLDKQENLQNNLQQTPLLKNTFDVSEEALEKIPELYRESQMGKNLTKKTFTLWFVNAIYQAFIILFITITIYSVGSYTSDSCGGQSSTIVDSTTSTTEVVASNTNAVAPPSSDSGIASMAASIVGNSSQLEILDRIIIFSLVIIQWLAVLIFNYDFNLFNLFKKLCQKKLFKNISVVTLIILLSFTSFYFVYLISNKINSLNSLLFILGEYLCVYKITLLALCFSLLPFLLIAFGKDSNIGWKLVHYCNEYFFKKNNNVVDNNNIERNNNNDSLSLMLNEMTEDDIYLLRNNPSAYVVKKEKEFKSLQEQGQLLIDNDTFYFELRNKIRWSFNLPPL